MDIGLTTLVMGVLLLYDWVARYVKVGLKRVFRIMQGRKRMLGKSNEEKALGSLS